MVLSKDVYQQRGQSNTLPTFIWAVFLRVEYKVTLQRMIQRAKSPQGKGRRNVPRAKTPVEKFQSDMRQFE